MGKLTLLKGDLLNAPEHVIVHGCNARGKTGSGVAEALKKKWPFAFGPYDFACASGALSLGDVVWAPRSPALTHYVGHAITQSTYGRDPNVRYASYDGIERALKNTVTWTEEHGFDTVALPMLGAGLGNAPWSVVRSIMEHVVLKSPITFNIYVLDDSILP